MRPDERYMRMALALAVKAEGRTSPNPLVGAVVVKGDRIVGRGYHRKCGTPHAEVIALRQARAAARGATLYVTLEPCNHYGRTPPCTDAVIRSGVRRVVVAMRDPNPLTDGKGLRALAKSGISTTVGVLADEAAAINRPFTKFMTTGMPYVTVKVAQSLDGKIATKTGYARWITGADSRRYVHRLRGAVDAIMVGSGTVKQDDPLLTCRVAGGKQPARIIVDSALSVSPRARVFTGTERSPVLIATTARSAAEARRRYARRPGIEVVGCPARRGLVDLVALMRALGRRQVTHLLVEGGGTLIASLIDARLVDRMLVFVAPLVIGGHDAPTSVEGAGTAHLVDAARFRFVRIQSFKRDIMIEAERCSPVL